MRVVIISLRSPVGNVCIGGSGEPLDPDVAFGLGREVDVEVMIRGVLRVERDAEKPALVPAQDPARNVEEWSRLEDAVLCHPDPTRLLHHEDASVVEWLRQKDGAAESAADERIDFEGEARRQRISTIAGTG